MSNSICGLDCTLCTWKDACHGCAATGGRPFGGSCMIATCCLNKKQADCQGCVSGLCALKAKLIDEFNALNIPDMETVTALNMLKGSYVNLQYTLASGQSIRFWDDDRIYLGNQLCKQGSNRCYGLTADETHLLVCEYGENGTDAEIVVYKRR